MEFLNSIIEVFTGLFDFLKGGEVAGILGMVQNILEYVKEPEAAGIIEINKNYFSTMPH